MATQHSRVAPMARPKIVLLFIRMPDVDDDIISNSALSRVSKAHRPHAVNNNLATLNNRADEAEAQP